MKGENWRGLGVGSSGVVEGWLNGRFFTIDLCKATCENKSNQIKSKLKFTVYLVVTLNILPLEKWCH